jgi:hypothetical protein
MMDSHTAEDKIEDKAWDVLKEMAHLRIIKDIRDELHMIKRVISEQDDVIEALYAKADPKRPANSKVTYVEERQLMENMKLRLQRVDKLELEALMVEQRVSIANGPGLDADQTSSTVFSISNRSRAISWRHVTRSGSRTRLSSERSRASSSRGCCSSSPS